MAGKNNYGNAKDYNTPASNYGVANDNGSPPDAYEHLMTVFDKLSAHYGPIALLYSREGPDGTKENYLITTQGSTPGAKHEAKHCSTCTCANHGGGLESMLGHRKESKAPPTARYAQPGTKYRQAA